MKLSLEKFKSYLDDEYSIEDLEQYEEALADRLFTLRKAMDMGSRVKIKGFGMSEAASIIEDVLYESLRDWFKKEKWVRISSSGKIAGPCGTSKNKKNPDRCLPKAKAQSLSKGERAATAAKKKKAGKKGKTVVKNTKKAKVTREDIRNLVVGTIHEMQNEGNLTEKDDRCTRLAKQKYDTWPSAYASGAVVRCRRGEIWKKK